MAYTKKLNELIEAYRRVRNAIEKLQEENKRLKKEKTTDELTGLPNKLVVYELLKEEILRVKRNENALSVSYFDIDRFKSINDTYGHEIGDKVIIYFANEVKKSLRKVDIVARLHGDEFLVVFPDTEKNSAYKVMEKVMNIKPYKIPISNKTIKVNASYGVTEFNGLDYKNMPIEYIIKNLIREADKKMYEHKKLKNTKNPKK